jgi:hypothetical protein
MFNFAGEKAEYEKEGVFIGGWSFANVLWPKKTNGVHGQWQASTPGHLLLAYEFLDSTEDRIAQVTLDKDWDNKEERALLRKLDLRVLLPCCICYFLAYLDRANIGNVKILQAETEDNIVEALQLQGRDFNWVSISSSGGLKTGNMY